MANNQIKLQWKIATISEGSIVGYLVDKQKINYWENGIIKEFSDSNWEYLNDDVWIKINDKNIQPPLTEHDENSIISYTINNNKNILDDNTGYNFRIYPVYNINGLNYFQKIQFNEFGSIFNFNLLTKDSNNNPFNLLTNGIQPNIKYFFRDFNSEKEPILILNTTDIIEKLNCLSSQVPNSKKLSVCYTKNNLTPKIVNNTIENATICIQNKNENSEVFMFFNKSKLLSEYLDFIVIDNVCFLLKNKNLEINNNYFGVNNTIRYNVSIVDGVPHISNIDHKINANINIDFNFVNLPLVGNIKNYSIEYQEIDSLDSPQIIEDIDTNSKIISNLNLNKQYIFRIFANYNIISNNNSSYFYSTGTKSISYKIFNYNLDLITLNKNILGFQENDKFYMKFSFYDILTNNGINYIYFKNIVISSKKDFNMYISKSSSDSWTTLYFNETVYQNIIEGKNFEKIIIDNIVFFCIEDYDDLGNSRKSFTLSIDQSFPSFLSLGNNNNGIINFNWEYTGLLPIGEFSNYNLIIKKTAIWNPSKLYHIQQETKLPINIGDNIDNKNFELPNFTIVGSDRRTERNLNIDNNTEYQMQIFIKYINPQQNGIKSLFSSKIFNYNIPFNNFEILKDKISNNISSSGINIENYFYDVFYYVKHYSIYVIEIKSNNDIVIIEDGNTNLNTGSIAGIYIKTMSISSKDESTIIIDNNKNCSLSFNDNTISELNNKLTNLSIKKIIIDNITFNSKTSNNKDFLISIDQSFPTISVNNSKNGKIDLNWLYTELPFIGSFSSYNFVIKEIAEWNPNNLYKLIPNNIKKLSIQNVIKNKKYEFDSIHLKANTEYQFKVFSEYNNDIEKPFYGIGSFFSTKIFNYNISYGDFSILKDKDKNLKSSSGININHYLCDEDFYMKATLIKRYTINSDTINHTDIIQYKTTDLLSKNNYHFKIHKNSDIINYSDYSLFLEDYNFLYKINSSKKKLIIDNIVFNINSTNKINEFTISIEQSYPSILVNNLLNGKLELIWNNTELPLPGSFLSYNIEILETGNWNVINSTPTYFSVNNPSNTVELVNNIEDKKFLLDGTNYIKNNTEYQIKIFIKYSPKDDNTTFKSLYSYKIFNYNIFSSDSKENTSPDNMFYILKGMNSKIISNGINIKNSLTENNSFYMKHSFVLINKNLAQAYFISNPINSLDESTLWITTNNDYCVLNTNFDIEENLFQIIIDNISFKCQKINNNQFYISLDQSIPSFDLNNINNNLNWIFTQLPPKGEFDSFEIIYKNIATWDESNLLNLKENSSQNFEISKKNNISIKNLDNLIPNYQYQINIRAIYINPISKGTLSLPIDFFYYEIISPKYCGCKNFYILTGDEEIGVNIKNFLPSINNINKGTQELTVKSKLSSYNDSSLYFDSVVSNNGLTYETDILISSDFLKQNTINNLKSLNIPSPVSISNIIIDNICFKTVFYNSDIFNSYKIIISESVPTFFYNNRIREIESKNENLVLNWEYTELPINLFKFRKYIIEKKITGEVSDNSLLYKNISNNYSSLKIINNIKTKAKGLQSELEFNKEYQFKIYAIYENSFNNEIIEGIYSESFKIFNYSIFHDNFNILTGNSSKISTNGNNISNYSIKDNIFFIKIKDNLINKDDNPYINKNLLYVKAKTINLIDSEKYSIKIQKSNINNDIFLFIKNTVTSSNNISNFNYLSIDNIIFKTNFISQDSEFFKFEISIIDPSSNYFWNFGGSNKLGKTYSNQQTEEIQSITNNQYSELNNYTSIILKENDDILSDNDLKKLIEILGPDYLMAIAKTSNHITFGNGTILFLGPRSVNYKENNLVDNLNINDYQVQKMMEPSKWINNNFKNIEISFNIGNGQILNFDELENNQNKFSYFWFKS